MIPWDDGGICLIHLKFYAERPVYNRLARLVVNGIECLRAKAESQQKVVEKNELSFRVVLTPDIRVLMAKQLLIYERAVPVNPRQHRDLSVKSGADFGFAKQVNSVPLMAAEFEPACSEYAIVFAGQGKEITPVALLGVRDQENLYVDDKGAWNAKYIPAFVRRYPFVFSSDNSETLTLCVDE